MCIFSCIVIIEYSRYPIAAQSLPKSHQLEHFFTSPEVDVILGIESIHRYRLFGEHKHNAFAETALCIKQVVYTYPPF